MVHIPSVRAASLGMLAGMLAILALPVGCGSGERAPGEGEACELLRGETCSGYCVAVGTFSSCEGGGLCVGPAGDLTCAHRCQTNADCAGHAPATACTHSCTDAPRLEGYCVEPSLPDRFISFPCSVTPPATDGGRDGAAAPDGGASDGGSRSTLGTTCAPVCALPICTRIFMSSAPDPFQLTAPVNGCPSWCVTSTGGARYCTGSCTSDSDCANPNLPMFCLTGCTRDPSSVGVGQCWALPQYEAFVASCRVATDAGADGSPGCQAGTDCPSGYCAPGGRCLSTCGNGMTDGVETDVDCGGAAGGDGVTCSRCANDRACTVSGDCQSGYCSPAGRCASTCANGIKDNAETDVDCGGAAAANGAVCAGCVDGKTCALGPDCASRYCAAGRCAPQPIPTAVVAGGQSNCVLFGGGLAKCWGVNTDGQLGLGDTATRGDGPNEMGPNLPLLSLGAGSTVRALAVGLNHACALLDNGQVKCWGENDYGQLGLGDVNARGDAPGEMGDALAAVDLGAGRAVVAISAGRYHTCALLDNGQVKCWGENAAGQLGLGSVADRGDAPGEMGDNLPPVDLGTGRAALAVSAGGAHTCALLDNGQVKCWGDNGAGQTGIPDEGINTEAIGNGPNEMGDNLPPVDLGSGPRAIAVSAGGSHACALLETGQVKCWGSNSSGQLGLGDTQARGDEEGEMGDALPAVALGAGRTATAVTAGSTHTCALLDDRQLKCWGYNLQGRLGLGDAAERGDGPGEMGDALPAVSLGAGRSATRVVVGAAHTCALLEDARVKCWGGSGSGQLGLGDRTDRGDNPNEMGDNLPAVVFW